MDNYTDSGYKPQKYVIPKDEDHAYNFLKERSGFVDLSLKSGKLKEKAEMFFEYGEPYNSIYDKQPYLSELNNIKIIRNAITHLSIKSKKDFDNFIRNVTGSLFKPDLTPGEFLAFYENEKKSDYLLYYIEILSDASLTIVK